MNVFAAAVVIGGVLGWLIGNHAGWLIYAHRDGYPYNWRLMLGPGSYFAWIDRMERSS